MSLPLLECGDCGCQAAASECPVCESTNMHECECHTVAPPCATGYVSLADFDKMIGTVVITPYVKDRARCATCLHLERCHVRRED